MSKNCTLTLSAAALTVCLAAAGSSGAEPPAGSPPTAPSGWAITSETSALDGSTTFSAALHASGTVTNSAGVEAAPVLGLRCRGQSGLDVMVTWPVFLGLQTVQAAYKLDEGPIVRSTWDASTDGTAMFYPADRQVFVGALAKAHRLVVQTNRYQGGPIEAVFELGEITSPAEQALKVCA